MDLFVMFWIWLQVDCNFQDNEAISYDSRFCYVTTLHIDVYSGKVWPIFIFNVETPFFGKNIPRL